MQWQQEQSRRLSVVSRALDILAESRGYTPGVRMLRQLAEPLRSGGVDEVRPVASRFGLLASGLPETPRRERVSLELLLAEQECRWNWDSGADRVMSIYADYATSGIAEGRADALAQVLLTVDRIDPDGTKIGIRDEITGQFRTAFSTLLDDWRINMRQPSPSSGPLHWCTRT